MIVNKPQNEVGHYISHFGIHGQKWGLRRFQSYQVAPTRSGMVGQETGEAAEQGQRQMSKEEMKEKYSKSPTAMYMHKDLYTTKELNDAINRFNAEDALKRKISERNIIAKFGAKADRIAEAVITQSLTEVGKTVLKAKMADAIVAAKKPKHAELPGVISAVAPNTKQKKGGK